MILDASLAFDGPTPQPITGSRDSTNVLGLSTGRDMSAGGGANLLILSDRNFAGGTSLTIALQGAPDNGSGGAGTYTTYAETAPITLAQLNAVPGMLFPIALPRPPGGAAGLPRFYKLAYTVAGTFTAGALQAYLLLGRDDVVNYPSAVSLAGV